MAGPKRIKWSLLDESLKQIINDKTKTDDVYTKQETVEKIIETTYTKEEQDLRQQEIMNHIDSVMVDEDRRESNEVTRIENETLRQQNEGQRSSNEDERKANEQQRVNYYNEIKRMFADGELNGKSLEFIWDGTQLGVRVEGQLDYYFSDLQGVEGEKGEVGSGVKLLAVYNTYEELINDYPDGSNLDGGFLIGDNFYFWSIITKKWESAGSIKGPKVVLTEVSPPIEDREKEAFYFIITDKKPQAAGSANIKVSPTMGIKKI